MTIWTIKTYFIAVWYAQSQRSMKLFDDIVLRRMRSTRRGRGKRTKNRRKIKVNAMQKDGIGNDRGNEREAGEEEG